MFAIVVTATTSTPRSSARIATIWSPSIFGAALVDREHPVAVAVEGDAEIEAAVDDERAQRGEVGRAAADVDVRSVRVVADRFDVGAELRERVGRDAGVRAVRAVDRDAQAGQVGAEALEHVLEVALHSDADTVDLAAARRGRVEQRLDLLLRRVGELASLAVEELDAVVLRRVVRRRDDDAEVEAEQRDRGSRDDAGEDRRAARGDDAACERLFELRARRARVASDEDLAAAGPERRRLTEALDEIGRQELADDPANSICSKVLPGHSRRGPGRSGRKGARQRFENCGALRALCRPAFLRSTWRASRVR